MQTIYITPNGEATTCPVRSGLLAYAQRTRVSLADIPSTYAIAAKRGR